MDDKHVEGLLRESWDPQPPDGMRERLLRAAAEPRSRHWFCLRVPRWQAALVAASLLVIVLSGISDSARQRRIVALSDAAPSISTRMAACPDTLGRLRFGLNETLDYRALDSMR